VENIQALLVPDLYVLYEAMAGEKREKLENY
jgi:hypothetical protein